MNNNKNKPLRTNYKPVLLVIHRYVCLGLFELVGLVNEYNLDKVVGDLPEWIVLREVF